jgi:hypothetical protein
MALIGIGMGSVYEAGLEGIFPSFMKDAFNSVVLSEPLSGVVKKLLGGHVFLLCCQALTEAVARAALVSLAASIAAVIFFLLYKYLFQFILLNLKAVTPNSCSDPGNLQYTAAFFSSRLGFLPVNIGWRTRSFQTPTSVGDWKFDILVCQPFIVSPSGSHTISESPFLLCRGCGGYG